MIGRECFLFMSTRSRWTLNNDGKRMPSLYDTKEYMNMKYKYNLPCMHCLLNQTAKWITVFMRFKILIFISNSKETTMCDLGRHLHQPTAKSNIRRYKYFAMSGKRQTDTLVISLLCINFKQRNLVTQDCHQVIFSLQKLLIFCVLLLIIKSAVFFKQIS